MGDFQPAGFAFAGQLPQLREDGLQQLHDDGRGDVGVDAHRRDGEARHGPAGEHIKHAEQCLLLENGLDGVGLHAGHGDVRDQPE